MELEDLGYRTHWEKFRMDQHLNDLEVGRVIAEHKERYIVQNSRGEFEAEITGHMRFTAKSREDYPAVGDWVALKIYESDLAIIHQIFPRFSILKRKAVGHFGEIQVIASNIDYAFLVQAVDRDFNINRLERYLTICYSAHVTPIIILNKIDLVDEHRISELLEKINSRIKNVSIIPISNQTQEGYDSIEKIMEKRKTYCLLGSSGVGKSTLLNNLAGKSFMTTDSISQSTSKGKHVTSHRALIVLANGGILIDNPGMREVGITDSSSALETVFDKFADLSGYCKFKDCTHTNEMGCAVLQALEKGEIDQDSYENYLKMRAENAHFESTAAEKRKKDKEFGKIMKHYKKEMKKKKK
jgi:ribosome biogenesis GTPase / thiamine phosphate phosphatase